jgi:hypothetical protein
MQCAWYSTPFACVVQIPHLTMRGHEWSCTTTIYTLRGVARCCEVLRGVARCCGVLVRAERGLHILDGRDWSVMKLPSACATVIRWIGAGQRELPVWGRYATCECRTPLGLTAGSHPPRLPSSLSTPHSLVID